MTRLLSGLILLGLLLLAALSAHAAPHHWQNQTIPSTTETLTPTETPTPTAEPISLTVGKVEFLPTPAVIGEDFTFRIELKNENTIELTDLIVTVYDLDADYALTAPDGYRAISGGALNPGESITVTNQLRYRSSVPLSRQMEIHLEYIYFADGGYIYAIERMKRTLDLIEPTRAPTVTSTPTKTPTETGTPNVQGTKAANLAHARETLEADQAATATASAPPAQPTVAPDEREESSENSILPNPTISTAIATTAVEKSFPSVVVDVIGGLDSVAPGEILTITFQVRPLGEPANLLIDWHGFANEEGIEQIALIGAGSLWLVSAESLKAKDAPVPGVALLTRRFFVADDATVGIHHGSFTALSLDQREELGLQRIALVVEPSGAKTSESDSGSLLWSLLRFFLGIPETD